MPRDPWSTLDRADFTDGGASTVSAPGRTVRLEPAGRLGIAVDLDRLGGFGFDPDRSRPTAG